MPALRPLAALAAAAALGLVSTAPALAEGMGCGFKAISERVATAPAETLRPAETATPAEATPTQTVAAAPAEAAPVAR
jgi:hypothetical protein